VALLLDVIKYGLYPVIPEPPPPDMETQFGDDSVDCNVNVENVYPAPVSVARTLNTSALVGVALIVVGNGILKSTIVAAPVLPMPVPKIA
jgi:hypothetical protein